MKKLLCVLVIFFLAMVLLSSCSWNDEPKEESDISSIQSESKDGSSNTTISTSEKTTTSDIEFTDSDTSPLITDNITADEVGGMAESIIKTAQALIGISFVAGGQTPDQGFDNSGFIYFVLRENGYINCPRQGIDQTKMGQTVTYEELRVGDLAFFTSEDGSVFGGIYSGAGKMIYSPMPGRTVCETDITSSYWMNSFYTGVKIT